MVSIEMRGRIRWADADAAGRLHFPRMFEYFEDGEYELLRSVGFSMSEQGSEYDFPRVHVECDFMKVLALNAPFVMRVTLGNLGRSSIRFEYEVFADDDKQDLALKGSMIVVVVKDGQASEIPSELRAALSGEVALRQEEG
jgi:acyl-CoA thioester hydrolase